MQCSSMGFCQLTGVLHAATLLGMKFRTQEGANVVEGQQMDSHQLHVTSCTCGPSLLLAAARSKLRLELYCNVQALMKSDEKVADFLTNPIIPGSKRKDVLKALGQKAQLNEVTVNFVSLLIDNDRLVAYAEIFDSFEQQYCALTDTQVRVLPCSTPAL